MFGWLRELLELKAEFRERKYELENRSITCESCESLKAQLERANYEREQLINNLIKPPAPMAPPQLVPVSQPRPSRFMPNKVRMQMIADEDRQRARILKEYEDGLKDSASKVNLDVDTEPRVAALEKDMGIR